MNVKITKLGDNYHATVENKKGHRYLGIYVHPITKEEVKEDFKTCQKSFHHIN